MKRFVILLFLGFLVTSVWGGQTEPIRVGILVYNGVYNTEFVAPMDIFDHVNGRGGEVEVFLVSPDALEVRSVEKLRFRANFNFSNHPPIDILVIPSFENYEQDLGGRRDVIDWIRTNSASADWVLSNCWGAFFLAKAGVLDGRMAMTYPPDIPKLAKQFPKLTAIEGQTFVRDGKFVTGGGGVASYDNALYVVEQIWGRETAKGIAGGLVKEWELSEVKHKVR